MKMSEVAFYAHDPNLVKKTIKALKAGVTVYVNNGPAEGYYKVKPTFLAYYNQLSKLEASLLQPIEQAGSIFA